MLVLCGCGTLVPTEKRVSQSVQATEAIATESEKTTRRTLSVVPEMAAKIVQQDGVSSHPLAIQETLEEKSRVLTGAGSKDAAKGTSDVKIPFWVGLIGAGIGTIVLVFGIKYAISSAKGTAFGSAISLGDKALSSGIDAVGSLLSLSKDDGEIARLTTLRANLEKERGKLKSQ